MAAVLQVYARGSSIAAVAVPVQTSISFASGVDRAIITEAARTLAAARGTMLNSAFAQGGLTPSITLFKDGTYRPSFRQLFARARIGAGGSDPVG